MAIQFREKALMALETMPSVQKDKVSNVLKKLAGNQVRALGPHQLKGQVLDTWVVPVDSTVRLLFTKTEKGFLVIDIIDRTQTSYS